MDVKYGLERKSREKVRGERHTRRVVVRPRVLRGTTQLLLRIYVEISLENLGNNIHWVGGTGQVGNVEEAREQMKEIT